MVPFRLGLQPDSSAMSFHDLLGDGQANACARVFVSAMQALEYGEDSIKELRIDAYSVICTEKIHSSPSGLAET